ncbi:MAG: nucleotide exchange factor GrpE [Firmicutes bacterium]|nr:nucleotide exchange factor GrpE [Bacillota bacterium]MCL2255804.1 nucleotide exchange factor GrpE [Bacillota bacterium]
MSDHEKKYSTGHVDSQRMSSGLPPLQKDQKGNPETQLIASLKMENATLKDNVAQLAQSLEVSQIAINKEKERTAEMSNLATRMQADFDNYRKRTKEAEARLKEDGIVDVFAKILPCLDTFKHGIKHINDDAIADGLKMIYRQFNDTIASFGVTEVPALGEQFDPNLHDAVMRVKVKDPENINIVVEVFKKGYKLGDRVIRHSVVKVGI